MALVSVVSQLLWALVTVCAASYCGWRVLQNWQSELQGLLGCLYKLTVVLVLSALARFCFSI